ncbi:MAG: ATP-dependent DNA helicase RecG [Woeseiaceae bacterium]
MPTRLTDLRGVGPALAEKLNRLGVATPADLLFLLPQRYEDRTRVTAIGGLTMGQRAVVEGRVELTEVVYRRRRSMLVRISDNTGMLTLRFFYFSRSQQTGLPRGARVRCFGDARSGPSGLEMIHPEYRVLSENEEATLEDCLTPIYPATEGIQQARLRGLIAQALDRVLPELTDLLPADLLTSDLPKLMDSIVYLHRPPPDADLNELSAGKHPCQRRLALEEMLAHYLSLRRVRESARLEPAVAMKFDAEPRQEFLAGLGFKLTGDQQATLADIDADLARAHPMMRLVQGDVGCGKTVVAAAAALTAVQHGHQVAIMAPTELLAEQHRDSFAAWFDQLGINIAWLSGSLKKKARDHAYTAIKSGTAQVVIGTHALFQEGLEYDSLALVIVDEQHRFGVHQRLQLMNKGRNDRLVPHQLVMTATPIPRTLAMTMYADLDTSIIRELPPGRLPTNTIVLPEERRTEVITRVRDACAAGRQAYWVCPLVEDSDVIQSQAAESTHAALRDVLTDISVGLVHGRMKPEQKEAAMKSFNAGKTQLLVATTVIEVGVDVPNASLMIIENAERMGLSQLHQLRGRIGRGAVKSTCVLMYKSPLSALAKQRLAVLRDTNDGFKIAQRDLELRGPGEVLGTRQTGLMQMRVADLMRDADLAPDVQNIAGRLLADNPDRVDSIISRWIGPGSRYRNV